MQTILFSKRFKLFLLRFSEKRRLCATKYLLFQQFHYLNRLSLSRVTALPKQDKPETMSMSSDSFCRTPRYNQSAIRLSGGEQGEQVERNGRLQLVMLVNYIGLSTNLSVIKHNLGSKPLSEDMNFSCHQRPLIIENITQTLLLILGKT